MALNLNNRYPGRANPPSIDYPEGSIKNQTAPGARDGTPLDADWANDKEGLFQSILSYRDVAANGVVDKVGNSQYFNALYSPPSATKRGQPLVATNAEAKAGASTELMITPSNLSSVFTSEFSASVNGYQKFPSGLIENWGTVTLAPVGNYNQQVIGGVTWYSHFYTVALQRAYTTRHMSVVATLAGAPLSNQYPQTIALIGANKTVDQSSGAESLTGFTVAITTTNLGYVPTVHFISKGV